MSAPAYGIDLGTSNIKIYESGKDHIFLAKNMIAIKNKNTLFAYGDEAYEMYEKAPMNIHISYPLTNGVIADINHMQTLVKCFIGDLTHDNIHPADYYISVPHDVTEVEQRAFNDLIKNAGVKAKKVMVVEKAIADGLGMDIDVKNSQGVLVVDVGFNTTEISVLSLGGIVSSRMIKVGGLKFDDAIRAAIRKEYNLMIGGKSAEKIKMSLRNLEDQGASAVVYGLDLVSGLPVEREIPTELIDITLKECFDSIVDLIKVILERTPPELAADIYRKGMYLTGGACQVAGLDELIADSTGLNVNTAANPIGSVALGLARVINDDNFKSVAYSFANKGEA
ncbi:MAG: rod shape-determining protein [Lachnospiraceae bacterium]|nr:rod shape-determining protein [Lachnospiraceae bacterium]